jgi:hypothetical protein
MPPAGGFAAKLLSGVLDGWTARHQQGLAQQREDEVYQTQLADRERLAGERRQFETEQADVAYGREEDRRTADIAREDELIAMGQAREDILGALGHERAKELAGLRGGGAKVPNENAIFRDLAQRYGGELRNGILTEQDIREFAKAKMVLGDEEEAFRSIAAGKVIEAVRGSNDIQSLLSARGDENFEGGDINTALTAYNANNAPTEVDFPTTFKPGRYYSLHGLADTLLGNNPLKGITPIPSDPDNPRSQLKFEILDVIYEIVASTHQAPEERGPSLEGVLGPRSEAALRGFGKSVFESYKGAQAGGPIGAGTIAVMDMFNKLRAR